MIKELKKSFASKKKLKNNSKVLTTECRTKEGMAETWFWNVGITDGRFANFGKCLTYFSCSVFPKLKLICPFNS